MFLSYMIVSSNDDKGHGYCSWSQSRIVRWSTDVSVNTQSIVETACIVLVACVCCDRIFVIENTELIVTYVQVKKL